MQMQKSPVLDFLVGLSDCGQTIVGRLSDFCRTPMVVAQSLASLRTAAESSSVPRTMSSSLANSAGL